MYPNSIKNLTNVINVFFSHFTLGFQDPPGQSFDHHEEQEKIPFLGEVIDKTTSMEKVGDNNGLSNSGLPEVLARFENTMWGALPGWSRQTQEQATYDHPIGPQEELDHPIGPQDQRIVPQNPSKKQKLHNAKPMDEGDIDPIL